MFSIYKYYIVHPSMITTLIKRVQLNGKYSAGIDKRGMENPISKNRNNVTYY